MHTIFWFQNVRGKDHLEDLGVDGRITEERIFKNQFGKVWTGCMWLRIWTNEHGNETLGSIKGGELVICGVFPGKTLLHAVSQSVYAHNAAANTATQPSRSDTQPSFPN
jgi:hypothetical protein